MTITITIIGTGLIGTSLGMALRNARDAEATLGPVTITGYDRDQRATSEARGRLAIDRQARTLEEALADAQIVIVAVPAMTIREVFSEIGKIVRPGVIITDVVSTKAQVMAWARELLPTTIDFIGGHPMAGKERSGPGAADPRIFEGAIYCLTPATTTRPSALDAIDAMVRQVGAKPYYVDPIEHDHYVAGASHLPFLLSTALIEVTSNSRAWREIAPLAATGFRDISRLASGDPTMHRDICLTNRDALTRWIDETTAYLQQVRQDVVNGDSERLLEMFNHAHAARDEWLTARPNLRPGEDDFENITNMAIDRPSLFSRMFGYRPPKDQKQ